MTPGGAIAAVASPAGSSARAIVRVSGSFDEFDGLFTESLPRTRCALRANLRLGEHVCVPVLVAVSSAPASYTGEDSLDILLPGGPAIIDRALRAITQSPGVRHAEAGEFTARAYSNGTIDLEQAKGVAMIIAAASAEELRAARRFTDSAQGSRAGDWTRTLTRLLALVEAGIDFTDQEDVVAIEPATLASELHALRSQIEARFDAALGSEQKAQRPRVVLSGAPSAGKSTLMNALLGRRRSVVHEAPGTTRDAIAEALTLPGGGQIEIVDLAGLDSTSATELDRAIQKRTQLEIQRADAIVHCDPAGEFSADFGTGVPTILVRTKADQPFSGQSRAELDVCALDGWHLDELRARLAALVGMTGANAGGAIAARLDAALRQTYEHLLRAESLASEDSAQWELIAGEMRASLDCLGIVTGRVDPDEVLGLIFRTFCIGK